MIGSVVTVGELCDGLLEQTTSDPEKYRDQRNPAQRIGRIKKEFGTRSAASIRPYEISDWLSALKTPSGKRLSPASRNRYRSTFSTIYTYGKEREKVSVHPVRDVKRFTERNGIIRYLDEDEEGRLRAVLWADVEACGPNQPTRRKRCLQHIYELDVALGTGVRRSEQYRLTWDDVNFSRREIRLNKTKYGPGRVVHMIDDVAEALHELQKIPMVARSRSKDKPSTRPANSLFSLEDNKRWFKGALNKAGVRKFRWHDLRHTFCSRLVQNGVNLRIVQEAAGHRNITMTARYAHLNKTNLAEAMALLNRPKGRSIPG